MDVGLCGIALIYKNVYTKKLFICLVNMYLHNSIFPSFPDLPVAKNPSVSLF